MDSIIIRQPDDFHLHLRDGDILAATVPASAAIFARALVMPNIQPPADNAAALLQYRKRILAACPDTLPFQPLMAFYLTDQTTTEQIATAFTHSEVLAVKYYPAGATTHSQNGVTDVAGRYPIFDYLQQARIPLCIHAEIPDVDADPFEREARFIDRVLLPLVRDFPALRIVCEHASSQALIDFVLAHAPQVAATLTPHHLWFNRSALFAGGFNPHHYCLPVLKTSKDQEAVIAAALSGKSCFFAGTDSAPHPQIAKHSGHAPAGIYNAPLALALYTTIFDQHGALDRLENFCARFGADFYCLPLNTTRVELTRSPWTIPARYPMGNEHVVPMASGTQLEWRATLLED